MTVSLLSPQVRSAATQLASYSLGRVQDASGKVRVEDYLTVLAAITGEAALFASGVITVGTSPIEPGAPVFGDPINHVLTGDVLTFAELPATSVMGILVAEVVPATVPLAFFGSLEETYRHVAAGVGQAPWGFVSTTVPEANKPTVQPLRVAFDLRPSVDQAQSTADLPTDLRHVPCTLALAIGLGQVRSAIDMRIATTLAIEVVFGMAKMGPMTKAWMDAVAKQPKR